jgi:phenylacetate-coenzyme A ligase PaaK-like adenylate-forming protein
LIAGEDEMEENLKRLKELKKKINEAVPAYEKLFEAAKSIPDP